MTRLLLPALLSVLAAAACVAETVAELSDYPIRPVEASAVEVGDRFWAHRLRINRESTIPFAFNKCETEGRIENYKIAGGLSEKSWRGRNAYDDSDVTKVMEGAAMSLMTHPDDALEAYLARLTRYIAAAQEDDGYLYTMWTARDTTDINKLWLNPGGAPWGRISKAHQLYNLGHLYEAGAAHYRATGNDSLLEVCRKSAACVAATFGPGRIEQPPGHQEVELGLVKLFRVTGERQYLDLAKYFLDLRGRPTGGRRLVGTYSQDHKPVVEQSEAVGHSVRATYQYAAMADVAALTGDDAYAAAIKRLWDDVVTRKLYLTGGIGAAGGHEGFGAAYELPNLTAYCETCASIGMCFWNHRMFLMSGEAKYMDVLERTLYNGAIAGVSLDGTRFFYPNPLESDGRHARSPWFGTSCCPSNICRFIPGVPGYAYAARGDRLYVNLYMQGACDFELGESRVRVEQTTDYPWSGKVSLAVEPAGSQTVRATLMLRVPGWARAEPAPGGLYRYLDDTRGPEPRLKVNGAAVAIELVDGYARLSREWSPGDRVELELPMPIRRVLADERVEDNRGKAALERGPIVYCVEHPDVPDGEVRNLVISDTAPLATEFRSELLEGVQVITGEALQTRYQATGDGKSGPGAGEEAAASGGVATAMVSFKAIPYYAWAHRGKGEMAVWLPTSLESASPRPVPTIASGARVYSSRGKAVGAVSDRLEPRDSDDQTHPFLHFWPSKGEREWVEYRFDEPTKVSAVEVYWLDDQRSGGQCRPPASWRVVYRDGDRWREVPDPSGYGRVPDRYNRCDFTPVRTSALRLEIESQQRWSSGLHEWRVH